MKTVFTLACLLSLPAHAQYKCVVDGRTTYAERPCTPGAKPLALPRDAPVTEDERNQAAESYLRQKKVADEYDLDHARDQIARNREANIRAAEVDRKKERCAKLLRTAKAAKDESNLYRYHQGLIDDAKRRQKEAEDAHFTECYGTIR